MNVQAPSPIRDLIQSITRNPFLRVLGMGFLLLLLLIPIGNIESLIQERMLRRGEAERRIQTGWAGEQILAGPILTIPYETVERDGDAVTRLRGEAHLLPANLSMQGNLIPQVRRVGIFESVLYEAKLRASARFEDGALLQVLPEGAEPLWNQARLSLHLREAQAWSERPVLLVPGANREFIPATDSVAPFQGGMIAGYPLAGMADLAGGIDVDIGMALKGAEKFEILPLSGRTEVKLASSWADPGFLGGTLPSERKVGTDGFEAQWKLPFQPVNIPQAWTDRLDLLSRAGSSALGVEVLIPADAYQQTSRATKYAVLFLLLTFLVFFLFELFLKSRIHPMNYLLVGFALCMFYLLLLALTEHIGFWQAYAVSSVATVALIAFYARALVPGWGPIGGLAAFLAGLYGYLYILLSLEDYSLLMGTLGLFVILTAVMLLTRKVDWYRAGTAVRML